MARGDGWLAFMVEHPLAEASDAEEFWAKYLNEHPDVLHRLLADVYEAVYGADHPPTLDELWLLMSAAPRYASEPFGDAVRRQLNGRSVSWLALQCDIPQPVMSRLVNGVRPIVNIHDPRGSMYRLECIARALRVHPSYFEEWRRLWIMSLLDSAFSAQPSLSVGVFRRYSGFERTGR
jgi:hypothetical protein